MLYEANAAIFARLELNSHASWIFLPAALRIIFPLVFGSAGVVGLILGGYYVLPPAEGMGVINNIVFALLSGLTPLVGIKIVRSVFHVRSDLANLTPTHIIMLALACALSNAIILSAYMFLIGAVSDPLRQISVILIGDFLGMAIIVFLVSLTLEFALRFTRRPQDEL